HPGTVDGFSDTALGFLAAGKLDDDVLMNLLGRLQRPDLPNLPTLIARNLDHERSRGFGSLSIHRALTIDQLDDLLRLRPKLLDETAFVRTYLVRLQPDADVDWAFDAEARERYLERLESFVDRLSAAHNSLKAHVRFHRLQHDLHLGKLDKDRFLAYLRLPRSFGYVNKRWLGQHRRQEIANTQESFDCGFDSIGDDEWLVRAYLQHFFVDEDGYEPYARYLREDWLKRLFAETKILAGVGDMERWYSMLDDASYYESLKERVVIDFLPSQKRYFEPDEPVSVALDVKNVPTLLVKVFEIDTFDFHRDHGRDVDASIDLDGMVAGVERTYEYDDNPLRLVRREFDFPMLREAGTYIVEFIGNGLSSRAVIRKGRLDFVERVGSAGHVFRVYDGAGAHRPNATLWISGREYRPDDAGDIHVPFSSSPGRRTAVLRDGAISSLAVFQHESENYELHASVFVDREALLSGRRAAILVRPQLTVQGRAVALGLLEHPVLTIVANDLDGITTSSTVRDLELSADGDFVHEIRVPDRLASLTVQLSGKVRNLSLAQDQDLSSAPVSFVLNGIDRTDRTACPLLGRSGDGYVLDVLGKNGEPRPRMPLRIELVHRDFRDHVWVDLETDDRGRTELGALEGITSLRVEGTGSDIEWWPLDSSSRTMPGALFGVAGTTFRVPCDDQAVSLFELRGGNYFKDRSERTRIAGGFVELRELPAGDFELWLPSERRTVSLRVTAGAVRDGWAFGRDRWLDLEGHAALQIRKLSTQGETLRIELANAGASTRVHVFASRFVPSFDPFAHLVGPVAPGPVWRRASHEDSSYHAGREIGDEYRYILDRRFAPKYAGNMLRRPGILLNPWALDEAQTAIGLGGGAGGQHRGARGGERLKGGPSTGWGGAGPIMNPGVFANLDFLPGTDRLAANLEPDANGVVSVPLGDLGPGRYLHVVALDDRDTVYGSHALSMPELEPRSVSLANGLEPGGHFAEQRAIEFVNAGETRVVEDVDRTDYQVFDSLGSVFELFRTLSGSPDLERFNFLLAWPETSAERKLELYSEHACHELHFFLRAKDPAFFDEIVRPYLANKADKTFLDEWLLDEDLTRYLEPWRFSRLNIVEQILLTKRIAGQTASGARHLRELFELVPTNEDQLGVLFAATLSAGGLDAEDKQPDGAMDAPGRAPAPKTRTAEKLEAGKVAGRELRDEAPAEEAEVEELAEDADDNFFMGDSKKIVNERRREVDRVARKSLRQLYRAPETTRRFVEHNYWHRTLAEQGADMIPPNAFWCDWAESAADQPFASTHVAQAAGSFAEMMFALAVLDLPFHAVDGGREIDGNQLTIAGPSLLVRKQIRAVESSQQAGPILVSQNFYRLDDRYRYEGNERRDNFVIDEFLISVPYGCQVVLTNPSSSRRKLELLLQIPQGATPIQSGFYTRGRTVQLEPFATQTIDYAFYFAKPGTYDQFPVHVADGEVAVAFASPASFEVLESPRTVDTTSWEHVSQSGTVDEVFGYLDTHNLARLDLNKIAWRLRDRAVFDRCVELLDARHTYHHGTWSHGIFHHDAATTREYLRHEPRIAGQCGAVLDSALLDIDPIERQTFQLVEFHPLFNARAHRFGRNREILNRELGAQYHAFMGVLGYRPQLRDEDWLTVTYYMLLQDRVDRALEAFGRVRRDRLATELQYDYTKAYLAFYSDDPRSAREIVDRYVDHPVARWRALFRDVRNQLDELEGKGVAISDGDDQVQQQSALAASEPALDVDVESRRVRLTHANLTECEVNYYEMDVEFSFSTSPFVQNGAGSFAYIKPNRSDVVALSTEKSETVIDLPAEFRNSNVLVEVRAAGLARRQTYFANSLNVQVSEAYGQLRVTHDDDERPLPKVYVKVYKRTPNGEVKFHKDGYTDLRGKFDYASVSGDSRSAERFAILVMSENYGAVIQEVSPPAQ
ncbi:MAG: hypothetical protein KDB80_06370, partial [Planctomycetes bacterium]|nr:hypothetical protein [Planctomycetota bacterium]